MAEKQLGNIFLSASIPLENRNPKYFKSADIVAIRDSVIALTTLVLPKFRLIWGGHPSITPLIRYVAEKNEFSLKEHVELYQSLFFRNQFPKDNSHIETIKYIESSGDIDGSIKLMRKNMLEDKNFVAGIFIGGMEGVEIEYKMFQQLYPEAILLPIASTGAAAKIIYDKKFNLFANDRLMNDYGYMSLFLDLLIDKVEKNA